MAQSGVREDEEELLIDVNRPSGSNPNDQENTMYVPPKSDEFQRIFNREHNTRYNDSSSRGEPCASFIRFINTVDIVNNPSEARRIFVTRIFTRAMAYLAMIVFFRVIAREWISDDGDTVKAVRIFFHGICTILIAYVGFWMIYDLDNLRLEKRRIHTEPYIKTGCKRLFLYFVIDIIPFMLMFGFSYFIV